MQFFDQDLDQHTNFILCDVFLIKEIVYEFLLFRRVVFLSISACLVLVTALITIECYISSCIKVMCIKFLYNDGK